MSAIANNKAIFVLVDKTVEIKFEIIVFNS